VASFTGNIGQGAIVYDVGDMDPITTGVVSNGIWAGLSPAARRLLRWPSCNFAAMKLASLVSKNPIGVLSHGYFSDSVHSWGMPAPPPVKAVHAGHPDL
jgi:hypothetical protein